MRLGVALRAALVTTRANRSSAARVGRAPSSRSGSGLEAERAVQLSDAREAAQSGDRRERGAWICMQVPLRKFDSEASHCAREAARLLLEQAEQGPSAQMARRGYSLCRECRVDHRPAEEQVDALQVQSGRRGPCRWAAGGDLKARCEQADCVRLEERSTCGSASRIAASPTKNWLTSRVLAVGGRATATASASARRGSARSGTCTTNCSKRSSNRSR